MRFYARPCQHPAAVVARATWRALFEASQEASVQETAAARLLWETRAEYGRAEWFAREAEWMEARAEAVRADREARAAWAALCLHPGWKAGL